MDEEHSAGAVVFHRDEDGLKFLLLHHEDGHWDFPKGHVEEGESEVEAMIREIKEETGLDVVMHFGFKETISYVFRAKYDGRLKHKTVDFFLAEAKDTKVTLSHEHTDYRWLPYEEALNQLTHDNTRNVLRKAYAFINIEDEG